MNIHPLFVHFPIALLSIYVFLELVTPFIKNVKYKTGVEHTKSIFIIFGAISLVPTLVAGDIAAGLINAGNIVETHEMFAQLTAVVFYILAFAYLLPVVDSVPYVKIIFGKYKWLTNLVAFWRKFTTIVMYPVIKISLAILGFILLLITGALGAGIVYGPNFDPFISLIYKMFI